MSGGRRTLWLPIMATDSVVFFRHGDENTKAREKSAKSTAPVPDVSRCLIHSRTSTSDALTPRRSNAAFNCDDGGMACKQGHILRICNESWLTGRNNLFRSC